MEVGGAADVVVRDRRPVRGCCRPLAIEVGLQDRVDRAVGARADLKCSAASGFEALAAPERFMTRCTRPGGGGTPGMCLYEQRIGAASVTVRFPREWLADWHGLVRAIDGLVASLRPPGR